MRIMYCIRPDHRNGRRSRTQTIILEKAMKRVFVYSVIGVLGLSWCGGCSDEAKTTKTQTVTTPEGKEKTTTEKTVEKSGKNPPSEP